LDQVLLYARRGPVAILTLHRPEVRNALSPWLYAELEQAVRGLDPEVRCVVVTGHGDAFCSGDDVKQIMSGPKGPPAEALARDPRLTPAADALLHTDVPVIAAVNGPAVGWAWSWR